MIGRYVTPIRCSYSREQACAAYWKACVDLGLVATVPLVSVLVAHGALECGNFSAGLWNNNPGNVKAGESWSGDYTCITLNEVLKGADGQYHERWFAPGGELTGNPAKGGVLKEAAHPLITPPGHPQTRMRSFISLDDGIEDKIRFLLGQQWSPVLEFAKRGDPSGYVRAIRARHYFTAYAGRPDPVPYETQVVSLFATYRPMVQAIASGALLPIPEPVFQEVPVGAVKHDGITDDDRARVERLQQVTFDQMLHPEDPDPEA